MFLGKYYHTLEAKGRISLPSEFRSLATDWVITRGLDGGLFLIPAESFAKEVVTWETRSFTNKAHRDFIRLIANEAKHITPDAQGRVQLPEYLITFAHLQKDVVIVGSVTKIEVWDKQTYHSYVDGLEQTAEAIAEAATAELNQNE